jgi:hypothetical protein
MHRSLAFEGDTRESKAKLEGLDKDIPPKLILDYLEDAERNPNTSTFIGNQLCCFVNNNVSHIAHATGPVMNVLRIAQQNGKATKYKFKFPILQITYSNQLLGVRFDNQIIILAQGEEQKWNTRQSIPLTSSSVHISWLQGEWGISIMSILTQDGLVHTWRSNAEQVTSTQLVDSPIAQVHLARLDFGAHPQTRIFCHANAVYLYDFRVCLFIPTLTI